MSLYVAFCVAVPALLAWSVAAAASWRLERGELRLAWRDGRNAATAVFVALILGGVVAGEPAGRVTRVALLSSGFAGAATGLFILLVCCRLRPAAAQALSGAAVAATMGAIFLAGAVIEAAPPVMRATRAELLANFSPYLLVAGDIFEIDVLHSSTLYGMHLADYLRGIPPYGPAAASWGITGLLLAGAGLGVRKAMERAA